jgi:hypothetical protein
MESISRNGTKLFRGLVRPDSKPVGTLSLETTGAIFTPAPGTSFTSHELFEISEFVELMTDANSGQRS